MQKIQDFQISKQQGVPSPIISCENILCTYLPTANTTTAILGSIFLQIASITTGSKVPSQTRGAFQFVTEFTSVRLGKTKKLQIQTKILYYFIFFFFYLSALSPAMISSLTLYVQYLICCGTCTFSFHLNILTVH